MALLGRRACEADQPRPLDDVTVADGSAGVIRAIQSFAASYVDAGANTNENVVNRRLSRRQPEKTHLCKGFVLMT